MRVCIHTFRLWGILLMSHVCVFTFVSVCIHMCRERQVWTTYTCIQPYLHTYPLTCFLPELHTYIPTHIIVCATTYVHAYIHTNSQICICTDSHTYSHLCTRHASMYSAILYLDFDAVVFLHLPRQHHKAVSQSRKTLSSDLVH